MFVGMNFSNHFLISSEVNFPLQIKENKYKCSLKTVEDNEGIPEEAKLEEGSKEPEQPGETHQDRELQVNYKIYFVLLI